MQKLLALYDRFTHSIAFLLVLSVLTVLSNTLGLELYVYTACVVMGTLVILFGRDLLPIFPIFVFMYVSPSLANNPGLNEQSVFYVGNGLIYMLSLCAVAAVALCFRLAKDRSKLKSHSARPKLLLGFLALGGAYMLSGIGYENYTPMTILHGFVQILCLSGLYFLMTYTVDWATAPKDYFAWSAFLLAATLCAELLYCYTSGGAYSAGTIFRYKIITGWGNCHNMAGMTAIATTISCYLVYSKKHGWVFACICCLFMIITLLSWSRSTIVFGLPVAIAALLLAVLKSPHPQNKRISLIVVLTVLSGALVSLAICLIANPSILSSIYGGGITSDSGRLNIYKEGLKLFARNPIFGGGFYCSEDLDISFELASVSKFTFLPARWHNTVVQLLSTGGLVAIIAYALHRWQTVRMLFKQPSYEKTFIALGILVLLLTSMLDCHFFNLGPGLLYSVLLALAENNDKSTAAYFEKQSA